PQRGDSPRGVYEIRLAGQRPRLAVVDRHDVHLAEDASQRVALALDPEVHGVERDEARTLLHLMEHVELELRIDVREEQIRHAPQALAERRPAFGADAELG